VADFIDNSAHHPLSIDPGYAARQEKYDNLESHLAFAKQS
jgi:hypothetical protein